MKSERELITRFRSQLVDADTEFIDFSEKVKPLPDLANELESIWVEFQNLIRVKDFKRLAHKCLLIRSNLFEKAYRLLYSYADLVSQESIDVEFDGRVLPLVKLGEVSINRSEGIGGEDVFSIEAKRGTGKTNVEIRFETDEIGIFEFLFDYSVEDKDLGVDRKYRVYIVKDYYISYIEKREIISDPKDEMPRVIINEKIDLNSIAWYLKRKVLSSVTSK